MALNKHTYQFAAEPVSSQNLNDIQDAIIESDQYLRAANNASLIFDSSIANYFTPTTGSSYNNFGNCFYYKIGTRVHIHIGVQGLTQNAQNTIYTMPAGYRPLERMTLVGGGGTTSTYAQIQIAKNGSINVFPNGTTYAIVDAEYDAFA